MAKRNALITGGMGGLGESISTKMHDAGFNVVVTHSPGNKNAAAWVADYKGKGYSFAAYGVDVADYDSCQACVAKVQNDVGAVDILINNAGITRDMTFKKMTKADWDMVIRTNLDSAFNMAKQVCDGMVERVGDASSMCPRSTGPKARSDRRTMRRPRPGCMDSPRRSRSRWQERA